jgi:hypothetical protein
MMALQKLEVLRSNFLFGKNKSSEVKSDLSAIKIMKRRLCQNLLTV